MEEGEHFLEIDVWSGRRVQSWALREKGFGCAALGGRLIAIHDGGDRPAPSSMAGSESQALGAEVEVVKSDHPKLPAIAVVTALSTTMLRRLHGAQRLLSVVAFSEVAGGG